MSVREGINRYPRATIIVVSSCIAVALVFVWAHASNGNDATSLTKRSFYTIDEGKTWFVDDIRRVPPFEYKGKQAVRCFVYRSKSGEFAPVLQKFSDSAKRKYGEMFEDMNKGDPPQGLLVKRPMDKEWVSPLSPRGIDIMMNIKSPDGSTPMTVYP